MIKHNASFTPVRPTARLDPVPAGNYAAGIIGAKVESSAYGERLILQVEIIEGPLTGYYKKLYDSQSGGQFAAKYKGTYSVPIPADENDPNEAWKTRVLNGLIFALQDSNEGYTWDWDEKKLKGKVLGIKVRDRDWIMEDTTNGGYRTGTSTEIGAVCDVNKVRDGSEKPLKKRELSQADKAKLAAIPGDADDSAFAGSGGFSPVNVDDELPF